MCKFRSSIARLPLPPFLLAIVAMLASGNGEGSPAEIASLMRAAGLPPDGRYLVAVMSAAASAMVTGPNADRWRCDLAGELALPVAEGALVAPLGDEIVLLVPSPGDRAPDDPASAAHVFAAVIRGAQPVLESDRSRIRLTVGVSAPAEGVTALSGAWHEAGSARRLVRGLRRSYSISAMRLTVIAAERAPIIATTIHRIWRPVGQAMPRE